MRQGNKPLIIQEGLLGEYKLQNSLVELGKGQPLLTLLLMIFWRWEFSL